MEQRSNVFDLIFFDKLETDANEMDHLLTNSVSWREERKELIVMHILDFVYFGIENNTSQI